MAGKFEVYRDRSGRFRWRLKAGNGEPIASGEAYDTKAGAVRATQAVQRAAAGATLSDLTSTSAGTSTGSAGTARPGVDQVVVLVQENHTTDNYFSGLAPWGANVAAGWPVQPNPATSDQPHD